MRPDGNGKGDKPRPLGVPMEVFDANFDAIFGKKKVKMEEIDEGVYLIEVTNKGTDNEETCNFKCADVGCGSDACSNTDCGK
jgi:hypothetical protein